MRQDIPDRERSQLDPERSARRFQGSPTHESSGAGERARAFQRLDNFGGVLVAENARLVVGAEIQVAELVLAQIEQVERFADQAAFDEFLRDDSAERFDVERLALGKVLDAACFLRRAAGDVLATPRDFFLSPPAIFSSRNWSAARRAFAADMVEKIEWLCAGRAFRFTLRRLRE